MEKHIFYLIISLLIVGCSDTRFLEIPNAACLDDPTCNEENGFLNYGDRFQREVDILFVVDNSYSMHVEQRQIANNFQGFINSLGTADYHIAITTTDMSDNEEVYQDGRLIPFEEDTLFLTKDTKNNVEKFAKTIQREETMCDPLKKGDCPSTDERGIYAAIEAVKRNEDGFIRKKAHLAVVFISDEDERSTGGDEPPLTPGLDLASAEKSIEEVDEPETLVETVYNKWNRKVMSFYAIVIPPGDSACLKAQHNQREGLNDLAPAVGEYGDFYAELTSPANVLAEIPNSKDINLVPGVLGSVCSPNYTQQLSSMGQQVASYSEMIQLECDPRLPINQNPKRPFRVMCGKVDCTNSVNISDSNILTFDQNLNVPLSAVLTYQYSCRK